MLASFRVRLRFDAATDTYSSTSCWLVLAFTAVRDAPMTLYMAKKSMAAGRHSARKRKSFCSVRPVGDSSQSTRDKTIGCDGSGEDSGAPTRTRDDDNGSGGSGATLLADMAAA